MHRLVFLSSCLVGLLLLVHAPGYAQSLFPVRGDSSGEAPDRTYDVLHYRIEVSFDEDKKLVNGRVTTTLVPFLPELKTVEFDAEQMQIHGVTLHGRPLSFSVHPKTLAITLDRTYSWNDTLAVTIDYSCTPKKGLYFVRPDSGYPEKPWQIWTQGEDMDNHFWFPCHDFPNDKSTSELIGTVRNAYTLVSNGRLVGVTENKAKKTKTFHWREDLPHASYLIMLAAGNYSVLHDRAGTVPLDYYVYPGQEKDAKACFAETPAIMRFFAEKIGIPFPWNKYAQVELTDFMYGGMENTSATTLLDESIVLDARARVDGTPASLIAHEMAHQWWGDLLTCRDWRHIWLNESFASYFDPLYFEATRGRDEFDFQMYGAQQAGIHVDASEGRKPIVSVGSYATNVYPRGASVLHMLRFVLGDRLFWKAINHYAIRYKFQSVQTNDFKTAVEEATGQNLYWFFDEWVYKAGHPVYAVSYTWNDTTKTLRLSVEQKQTLDSLTGVFQMPVEIEVTTQSGPATYHAAVWTRDTVLTFPCQTKPLMVIFDKGNWLLKELEFEKPRDEWKYQALHASNPVDRIRAVKHLSTERDSDDVADVYAALVTGDPFYGVRRQAADALGGLTIAGNAERQAAVSALLRASHDPRSTVRAGALEALRPYKGDSVVTTVYAGLRDSSYTVEAAALDALARVDSAHAADTIAARLTTRSRRSTVANAALHALARVDSSRAITAALRMSKYGEHQWTRFTALQILRRFPSARPELVGLLREYVHDKSRLIRSVSIRMLGEYGDAGTISLLEPIAADEGNDSAQAAKDAIKKLKEKNKTTSGEAATHG